MARAPAESWRSHQVLGVTAGLGSVALLVGQVDGRLAALALAVTAAALLLAALAALVPAIMIRRLPAAVRPRAG
ncbi:hypothetical protein [Micromonospora sp. HK10]|uniref:hypothetical protein n=1 Tax=Micromonospora sp. HK10 TaxID=1538294 RepID=UPI000626EFE1|nr:hypothetical protein [Micromonospora sp. HK10]KKK04955.1 hypothetical protein LQ51_16280 [Micromonospora sp. HK10]